MRQSLVVALAATLAVFCWQTLTVRHNFAGNWTALFFTGSRDPLPPELAAGTYVFSGSSGYDAPHYRYIAHDPLFRKGYDRYVEDVRLRYRRILVPALAWLAAFGQDHWIDAAYIGVVLLSVFLGVFFSAQYCAAASMPAAWGLIFLLTPGALTSIDRLLLDGMMTALAAGFMWADRCGHHRVRLATSLLAPLTKETGLLLPIAAAASELWRKQWRKAFISGAAAVPAIIWFIYVTLRSAPSNGDRILSFPFLGIVRRIFTLRALPDPMMQTAFRIVDLLAILGYAVTLWLAWRLMREDGVSASTLMAGLFITLAAILGQSDHMTDAYGYARPVSPLLLYVMLRGLEKRDWRFLTPPLLVSGSILIYFIKPALGILRGVV